MRFNFVVLPALPAVLPDGLEQEIAKLKEGESQEEIIRKAYELLTQKYRGYRIKTLTRLPELFDVDVEHLWARRGFLHRTNMNYLMKLVLVGTGRFASEDIQARWTAIHYCSPHQYLKIRIEAGWIAVDVWGRAYGIPFGGYAHGLHAGSMTSVL
jgi:hypothetical protein